ncbi:MAG: DUF3500 domain-containing protein [Psychroserpens sp.]|uniref:DUF3500 domain-containing protein n=1 Tax=Psychroserpens sp. TaxID=2020870 RepID=UPI00300155C9
MKRIVLIILLTLFIGCKQKTNKEVNAGDGDDLKINKVKKRFADMESNALKEPYKGVFTEEGNYDNLFPISSTGVSTKPIVNSAKLFLNSLETNQYNRTTFDINDKEWRKWCNVDNGIYDRQGVSLKEMNKAQKEAAFSLMQVSLSAKGLQLSKDIMKTDQTLKELNNESTDYDEELYFFTVMGEPSEKEPWGWQIDGHHLIINYFVLGDQVVMSPVFMGAEPIITTTGKYKGNTLFQDEQNSGLAFMKSLSIDQQNQATILKSKTKNSNVASANKDNLTLNYEGLNVSNLSDSQKKNVLDLMYKYISNMRDGHQQIKMEEVTRQINDTYFAWIGDTSDEAVFYYRIHSPVVLIEFDHQRVVGVPNTDDGKPSRNHIHTVVRTPNGNDYGKDLLRQHLEKQQH